MNAQTRLRLLPRSETPPDRFRYTFPQDGFTVANFDKDSWLLAIRRHYEMNEYPLPADWREQAEDQLCRLLPAGWCEFADGSLPASFIETRFDIHDFINGTVVLGSFKLSRDDVVDAKLAESRALACSRCYMNVEVPGCGACHAAANYIAEAAGGKETSVDQYLKACAVCKCSNKAAVWIPAVHLARGLSDEQLNQLRAVPWCWKAQEIDALNANPLP